MSDHKFKFGDLIENHYASNDNPRRKGIFIRKDSKGHLEMTDGKGKFWLSAADNDKLVKIGSVLEGSDPIPLPTIKPGDKVKYTGWQFKHIDTAKVEYLRVERFGTYAVIEYECEYYTVPLKHLEVISHD